MTRTLKERGDPALAGITRGAGRLPKMASAAVVQSADCMTKTPLHKHAYMHDYAGVH